MKINRLHAIIGFLLVVIPFTGFTRGFKYGFAVLAGATILYFAMRSIHEEIMKKHHKHRKHDSFVENRPKDTIRHEPKIEKTTPTIEEKTTEEVGSSIESPQETETNL